ncbi:MAG: hypothetical protein JOZ25_04270 [Actinobacteria bacterium]|nr:hypothetical protein [Actinomycetota bacterium]
MSAAGTGGGAATFSFRRDISVTVVGQVAVLVGGVLLYRLLATHKGASGLASYALVKQIVVFVFPAVMLGLQTGVPRYVALSRTEGGAESVLVAAIGITGISCAVVSALALAFPRATASLLMGSAHRTNLVVPLVATLASTVALEVVSGYLRGRLDFLVRTIVLVVGVAAFPVVLLIVIPTRPIGDLITLMAVALMVLCVGAAVPPLVRAVRAGLRRSLDACRALARYGFRRIPGEAAAIGLFTLTPIAAAHVAPLRQVAYISAGMQVLAMIRIAFQSIGLIFLPVLTQLWETNRETARRYVGLLTTCALHVALFATPQLLLFADVAIRAWLGPSFAHAGHVIRLMMLPVPVYVFYLLLHVSLDAALVRSYNSRNRVISLVVAAGLAAVLLGFHVDKPINAIAWSFAIGVLALGALTLRSVQSVFGITMEGAAVAPAVGLSAAAAAAGLALRATILGPAHSILVLVPLLALELALGAVYVAGLVRAGAAWPGELWLRLARRPG